MCLAVTQIRALLSGNKNYAISSTGTVDSCRSSILQYRNTFNYTWVQVGNTTRNAVNQNQRVGTCIRESTLTTYAESGRFITRSTRFWIYTKTGNLSLQHRCRINNRTFRHIFTRHSRYSTSQIQFFLCTETNDHHFVQRLWVFLQDYRNYKFISNRNILFNISNIRDL